MAYNIKKSMIQGTDSHKASVLKAKSGSIVSQAGIQADATLVSAGQALGKSSVGDAIDYRVETPDIKVGGEQEKAEETEEQYEAKLTANQLKIDQATNNGNDKRRNRLIDKRNKMKAKRNK